MATKVKGLDKIGKNLNKKVNEYEKTSMAGLIKAVIYIRREMDLTPPLIPIDFGNLRGSFFSNPIYLKGKPVVQFGFTAFYAWFVHEKIDPGINWKRPGSGPKFLEAHLKANEKEILEIIKNEVIK